LSRRSAKGTATVLKWSRCATTFQGHPDFLQPWENTCLTWSGGFPRDPFDIDYSVIYGAKDDPCPGPHDICGVPPGLVDPSIDAFDGHLRPDSPAIDAGDPASAPADDFDGRPRDASPDIGAYEYVPDGQVGAQDIRVVDATIFEIASALSNKVFSWPRPRAKAHGESRAGSPSHRIPKSTFIRRPTRTLQARTDRKPPLTVSQARARARSA
jgi:hypothetical protein